MPIVAVYTIGLFYVNSALWNFGNAGDNFLVDVVSFISLGNPVVFCVNTCALLATLLWLFMEDFRLNAHKLHPKFFFHGLWDATKYSLAMLAPAIAYFHLPTMDFGVEGFWPDVVIFNLTRSTGAGFYEELLFRVFLAGSILWVLSKVMNKAAASVSAGLFSSIIFSLWHFQPFGARVFAHSSFIALAILGVLFYVIYRKRGFGIAALTHSLYDIFYYTLIK